MKWFYLVIGLILSFNLTLWIIAPVEAEKERNLIKIQSLQSCYFSAIIFAKQDKTQSETFCRTHSDQTSENYEEIRLKMNEITDKVTVTTFYKHRFILWWNELITKINLEG